MNPRRALVIFLRLLFCATLLLPASRSFAQTQEVSITKDQVIVFKDSVYIPNRDTTVFIPDTVKYATRRNQYARSEAFYDSLKNKEYKNKVSKELFNLLITYRPPEDIYVNKKPVRSESYFRGYAGQRIRSVKIVRVDILEGSVNDTTLVAESGLAKAFNNIHTKTNRRVIRANLLFKEGDKVKPYLIADSERLVRSLSYVEDSRILITPDPDDLDVVDVTVVVKDRFPWGLTFSFSSFNKFRLGLTNRNIFGTGNLARVRYLKNNNKPNKQGYDIIFNTRNIGNSFIDISVFGADNYQREGAGLIVKKDFVSPEIKYGGELILERVARYKDRSFADSLYEEDARSSSDEFDFWLGRAFKMNDRLNLSVSARYLKRNFTERPEVALDSNEQFHNRDALLGAIYLTQLKFLKTKNILSFNITEDVPEGFILAIISGKDWGEFEDSNYVGFQAGIAKYLRTGFYYGNAEMGSFYTGENPRNQLYRLQVGYFTPLIKWGRSYNRTFARADFWTSNNLTVPISRNLDRENFPRGIKGRRVEGEQVLTGTIESVFFLGAYLYGFQFAPYVFTDWGYVSESRTEEPYKEFYYGVGPGIRIKNESLVFNTFELRMSYFPRVPEEGERFAWEISLSAPVFFNGFRVNKPRMLGVDEDFRRR